MKAIKRRMVGAFAALTTVALLSTGCGLLPQNSGADRPAATVSPAVDKPAGFKKSSVKVQVLYATSNGGGGHSTQEIAVSPAKGGNTVVDFSEDEVAGFGDMTRAASWNAVTVATLLTGAPLGTRYRFAFTGQIDGPSAGALTTAAILSLYYGDTIDPKTTMTGTIDPTGTVGLVGGVPEKIQGVIDSKKFKTALIPIGQRNSYDMDGNLVDVVKLGASKGVKVEEVGDIYQAYKKLTGKALPAPQLGDSPKISANGYDKLDNAGKEALARFKRAKSDFGALDPVIQEMGEPLLAEADDLAIRAQNLARQGLPGGAFAEAHQAAVFMEATHRTFTTVQSLFLNGEGAIDTSLNASRTALDDFAAFMGKLGAYHPKSVTDAEALVAAYGEAFDAFALIKFADAALLSMFQNYAKYDGVDTFLEDALVMILYLDLAQGQLEFAKSTFDVGRDNSGGTVAKDVKLSSVGAFFRKAANANWQAFDSGIIQPMAQDRGMSNDVLRNKLAGVDFEVALAMSGHDQIQSLQRYIGANKPNAEYAAMGYSYANYARTATLLQKYSDNGVLDNELNIVDVHSESGLSTALDHGRNQVVRALSVMKDKKTTPVISVAVFEQAGLSREGAVSDKFTAIAQYSRAFVLCRMMAFVGGFPSAGYGR
ncbi:S16 family serine protease [Rathayibacter soli]|uniref:S16 family serine protease n=1 Tax=Rathayibacter soli TaxID=3144168 RepID=UPI0027E3E224|nr:S16 family serine protease [Glaciibacter superstes]